MDWQGLAVLVTAIGVIWMQLLARRDAREARREARADAAATRAEAKASLAQSVINTTKISEVKEIAVKTHDTTNSKMSELIQAVGDRARREGQVEEGALRDAGSTALTSPLTPLPARPPEPAPLPITRQGE